MFNADIYDISSNLLDIQKEFFDENEETLSLSTYGYMNAVFSKMISNNVILLSELANESFPTKAKFYKNIITHAVFNGITDILAKPANMDIILYIDEDDFNRFIAMNNTNSFMIIEKEQIINIENFEFHLLYDLKITQHISNYGDVNYTSQYIMSDDELLSSEINPYSTLTMIDIVDGKRFIIVYCTLSQIKIDHISSMGDDNSRITSKFKDFEYSDQLTNFKVICGNGNDSITLYPILENSSHSNLDPNKKYCYYTLLSNNKVRIKFDKLYYIPESNTPIDIIVETTMGADGNFTYKTNTFVSLGDVENGKYLYDAIQVMVTPSKGESYGGANSKTIDEMKDLIKKEALSRNVISIEKDLDNYFNNLDTKNTKVKIIKKINNFTRLFYSYLIIKDDTNEIIPTNTLNNIIINETKLSENINYMNGEKINLIIKQGSLIGVKLNEFSEEICELIYNKDEIKNYDFVYVTPYSLNIDYNGPTVSSLIKSKVKNYNTRHKYINHKSLLQFTTSSYILKRDFNTDSSNYELKIKILQNIKSNFNLLEFVKDNDSPVTIPNIITTSDFVTEQHLELYMILYNKNNKPYKYFRGELEEFDLVEEFSYTFKFTLECNDIMDRDNRIKIDNCYDIGSENKSYGYFDQDSKVEFVIFTKIEDDKINRDINSEYIDSIIPNKSTYTICNIYDGYDKLRLYDNYSDLINLYIEPFTNNAQEQMFKISGLPVIGYDYSKNESNIQYTISQLQNIKNKMTNMLKLLKNQFGIDFKFYNTYGLSKTYFTDFANTNRLSKVNITLKFEIKINKISDESIKFTIRDDIKNIVENINNIDSLHIPNIITEIKTKYNQLIEYIEFKSINDLGPGVQHLYRKEIQDINSIPEILTIDRNKDGSIGIDIVVI